MIQVHPAVFAVLAVLAAYGAAVAFVRIDRWLVLRRARRFVRGRLW